MEKLKDLLVLVLLVITIVGAGKLFEYQDNQSKNNAIKQCGGINNITQKYTEQGDLYYICKK